MVGALQAGRQGAPNTGTALTTDDTKEIKPWLRKSYTYGCDAEQALVLGRTTISGPAVELERSGRN
jgi:hypothetical protein